MGEELPEGRRGAADDEEVCFEMSVQWLVSSQEVGIRLEWVREKARTYSAYVQAAKSHVGSVVTSSGKM